MRARGPWGVGGGGGDGETGGHGVLGGGVGETEGREVRGGGGGGTKLGGGGGIEGLGWFGLASTRAVVSGAALTAHARPKAWKCESVTPLLTFCLVHCADRPC